MNDKTAKYLLGASISIFVAASLAAITFPWRDSSNSSNNNNDCSMIKATDPDLENWQIETCGDGSVTWVSPEGARCVPNDKEEKISTSNIIFSCDDMVSKAKGYNIIK